MNSHADAPMRILIVEDNHALVANLFEFLEPCGHLLDAAPSGRSGLYLAGRHDYDVIVLDLMLPDMDGMEVCRRLREDARCETPVLVLTSKDGLEDKIVSFDTGADDYVVKPCPLGELQARMRALVRRARRNLTPSPELRVDDLTYDLTTQTVSRRGIEIKLSPMCRRILETLMREAPHIVPKEHLEAALWSDSPPDHDVLRAHIYLLRAAIDRPFDPPLLKTIPRVGYCLSSNANA